MAEYFDLIRERYSVRKFSGKQVEPEKVEAILEAARLAPTACNLQPQRILVLQGEEAVEKFRRCTMSHFNAPMAFLVCYDQSESWKRDYDGADSGMVDAAIAGTQLMLAAHALGIGTTWVMHFIPEAVREEFRLPEDLVPAALFPAGYPADDAKPFPAHEKRKPLSETCFYERLPE